ncbi:MAG TPA: 3-hydroxyacyl-CoA dehydrogenase NAD-binding domain-containing protein [Acidobacteriaceae bacterium]|nr:3-hydroxyacyl-CoA dehydrogenase NAD-binding domain-containing protein [Acidobacteriaceae bacterium]
MASLVRSPAGESGFREGIRTSPRRHDIRRVGVLGAGTMGARIAAHIANAGIPVLLLDLAAAPPNRNAVAMQALDGLKKAKPAAFADALAASLITVGNFDDDLEKLRECDWIVEAVAENLEIKRDLLAKVTAHIRPDTILTTNTSGLPVSKIAEALPDGLRSRWLGTHFFNPPRYMRLLEVIPTADTDPDVVEAISNFADLKLGKTIVRANDTPNFIANRIGVFAMLNTFRVMKAQRLSIEEIDLLTGPVIGWPKTGTFRLADMVGIDVIYNVARNFAAAGGDERSDLGLPPEIAELVKRKWLGDKTQQGFYKKVREKDGSETRLVFNAEVMDYRAAARVSFPLLEMLKSNESPAERIRALMSGNEKDKAAAFYRAMLPELWIYAAHRIGEVSRTLLEIDRAMKAGFNWELGPFEMWDAAGVPETVEIMRGSGLSIPSAVERLLATDGRSWYRDGGSEFFDPQSGVYQRVEQRPELLSVSHFEKSNGRLAGNAGVSLIDVGDGVGCFEFHSKMNTIGRDIVTFLTRELRDGSTAMASFDAFVVTSDAANFSAGANLMQLLLAIQDEEWDEIDSMVRSFQGMTRAIKFCSRPVIVAPFGLCLGGGTEISLHGAGRQAHLELYTGLIETSVGLVPAGGGCKEMLLRAIAVADQIKSNGRVDSVELHGTIKTAFETIAMAKMSASAFEARSLHLLDVADGISMNRDRLLFDAKTKALEMIRTGYSAPVPKKDIAAPGGSVLATLKLGVYLMREGEFITEHDVKVANHVARILAAGEVSAGTQVTEDYLLDLEREAFLSLCGEPKTAERIGYTLKTGKPLRN